MTGFISRHFTEFAERSAELFAFVDEVSARPPRLTSAGKKYYQFPFFIQRHHRGNPERSRADEKAWLSEHLHIYIARAIEGVAGQLKVLEKLTLSQSDRERVSVEMAAAVTEYYDRFLYGDYSHHLDNNIADLLPQERYPVEGCIDAVIQFDDKEIVFFVVASIAHLDLVEEKIKEKVMLDNWGLCADIEPE